MTDRADHETCRNCAHGRLRQWEGPDRKNLWREWFGPLVTYENVECRRWPRYEYKHVLESCAEFKARALLAQEKNEG